MSFSNLPAEIYLSIFQLLPKQAIFQCRLVCKAFYECATDAAFNTLIISKKSQQYMFRLSKRPDLGDKIKTLIFKHDDSYRRREWIREDHLLRLYNTSRYLKTIDLSESLVKNNHLEFLRNITSGLQHVDRILVSRNDIYPLTDQYLQLNLQLKETITHLELFEFDDAFFVGGSQDILNFFKDFIHLRSLSIRESRHLSVETRSIINLNLVDVLHSCRRLTNLHLYSLYRYPDAGNSSIDSLDNDTSQNSNLESLSLVFSEFKHPSCIGYISHNTTASLGHLDLQLTPSTKFDSWINDLDHTSLVALTNRLHTIRHVIIKTDFSRNYQPVPINQSQLEAQLLDPLNQFLSMIHDSFISCHLELESAFATRSEKVIIEILGGRLSLTFSVPLVTNVQGENLTWMQCLDSLHRTFDQQQYYVNSFDLQYRGEHNWSLNIDQDIVSFLLTRFTQLELLHVLPDILYSFNPLTSDYLSRYNLKGTVYKKYRSQLMPSSIVRSSISSPLNLRHAIFNDQRATRQLIENLGTYVPNLNTITLVGCGRSGDLQFQQLQELTFQLRSVSGRYLHSKGVTITDSYRYVLFQVEMQGYETLYYHWKLPTNDYDASEFERSTYKYLHAYKRWESEHNFTTAIRCTRVDTIRVVYKTYYNHIHIQSINPWEDRQPIASSSHD